MMLFLDKHESVLILDAFCILDGFLCVESLILEHFHYNLSPQTAVRRCTDIRNEVHSEMNKSCGT